MSGRWELLRGLLYPERCPFCDRVIGFLPVCPDCADEVEKLRHTPYRLAPTEHRMRGLEGAASLYLYKDAVRDSIHAMKCGARPGYARPFADELARELYGCTFTVQGGIIPVEQGCTGPDLRLEYDCIVPVPPSNPGQWYNLPTLLARRLSRSLGLPVVSGCLYKHRRTPSQAGLDAARRLVNLNGAFAVRRAERIEGRRILLVDDVITTGSTVSNCALALREAGAYSVFAVSVAASELEKETAEG